MAYNDIKKQGFREGVVIFEIDLDINDPDFDDEFSQDPLSFGTPLTTPDERAYKDGSFKTYRFSNQWIANLDTFPCLMEIESTPSKPEIGVSLGDIATASVSMFDFTTNDTYEVSPPYDDNRISEDLSFFSKLFSRNMIKYRPARIVRGYVNSDSEFSYSDSQIENYIVDTYTDPSVGEGIVEFSLADILILTNIENSKIPAQANGFLTIDIDDSPTTTLINYQSEDFESEYGVIGTQFIGLIDDEIMTLTVDSSTQMTAVRAQYNSSLGEHTADSTIQKGLPYLDVHFIDVVKDLFSRTSVPSSYIPVSKWDSLKSGELSSVFVNQILFEPAEFKEILSELISLSGIAMFTDVILQEITIVATPEIDSPVVKFTPEENILVNSLSVEPLDDNTITRQLIHFNKRRYTDNDESKNYSGKFEPIDDFQESPQRLGVPFAGETIFSNWLRGSLGASQASSVTERNVQRFSQVPKSVTFNTDSSSIGDVALGRMWIGSVFQIDAPVNMVSNTIGQTATLTCQCLSVKCVDYDTWEVNGISYQANIPSNVDFIITENKVDYVLATDPDFLAAAPDFGADREYTVLLSQGATAGGQTGIAFNQGVFPAGTLKLIIAGSIVGFGGNGGGGGVALREPVFPDPWVVDGFNGSDGGHALNITTNCVIDNLTGLIAGGGGGAGGRHSSASQSEIDENFAGQGGGGGQGATPGSGAAGGVSEGGITEHIGLPGEDATVVSPGNPEGGPLGTNGGNDRTAMGGASGNAIISNGNAVTFLNRGVVLGPEI